MNTQPKDYAEASKETTPLGYPIEDCVGIEVGDMIDLSLSSALDKTIYWKLVTKLGTKGMYLSVHRVTTEMITYEVQSLTDVTRQQQEAAGVFVTLYKAPEGSST